MGRQTAQRRALLFGVAESLFKRGKIKTTQARAKEARKIAERAITKAKRGTLASRRDLAKSFSPLVCKKLVEEIGPRFQERKGGYTRLIKVSRRAGDSAEVVFMELLD